MDIWGTLFNTVQPPRVVGLRAQEGFDQEQGQLSSTEQGHRSPFPATRDEPQGTGQATGWGAGEVVWSKQLKDSRKKLSYFYT